MAAIKKLAAKRVSFRRTLQGFNLLQKYGVLTSSESGLRCRMRGSHLVVHDTAGGPTTFVREHGGSQPATRATFLRKMGLLASRGAGGTTGGGTGRTDST